MDNPQPALNEPLRFLIVANVPSDPHSGAAGTVYHTSQALRDAGHSVDEILSPQLQPRRISHGNLHSLFEQPRLYRREVTKAVRSRSYDVVMISQPQGWMASAALKKAGFRGLIYNRSHGVELGMNDALRYWCREFRLPVSRIPALTRFVERMVRRQWKLAIRYSDAVIVPCENDRNCLTQEFPSADSRIHVIQHGVTDEFLRPLPQRTADTYQRLLYVGQHAVFKAPMVLTAVLNEVLQQRPDARMTWVTSGSAHAAVLADLNDAVRPRVTLRDWCGHSELLDIYDSHGVFIFPSLFEGAGKSSLEAMSRGLALIASDIGGMTDYVGQGRNGWLCPPGDTAEFVRRTLQSIDNPEDTDRMAKAGAAYAHKRTWRRCADNLVSLTRRLRNPASSES